MNRIISSLGLGALLAMSAAAGAANRESHPGSQGRSQGAASQERGQPSRQYDYRNDNSHDRRYDNRNDGRHDHYDNRSGRRDQAPQRHRGGWSQPPRGHVNHHHVNHQWRRGDRLPAAYYARPYVVYDYPQYHLYAPPRGYHWVHHNHDVLLTAIATGVVLDVLFNRYY